MAHRATGRHDSPSATFRLDLPRVHPAWIALLGSIKDVRSAAGQEGVDKFIDEWRKRGHIDCTDDEALRLKELCK